MRVRRRYVVAALLGVAVATLAAQRRNFFTGDFPVEGNPSYDGRLTFVRLRYPGYGGLTNEGPGWMHDYPTAERHLLKIMSEVSDLRPRTDSSSVFDFGNPELMKYPIAYFSEPGYWQPTDEDVKNIHDYLLKGGFMIIDDFVGPHWMNLEEQFRRALPEARFVRLDVSHPIFDSFFHIKTLSMEQFPYGPQFEPQYYGIFEDNDPKKRLMVIANYNNDLGDYMEWSDAGFLPIQITNEAYKLGVNYVIYGMTR